MTHRPRMRRRAVSELELGGYGFYRHGLRLTHATAAQNARGNLQSKNEMRVELWQNTVFSSLVCWRKAKYSRVVCWSSLCENGAKSLMFAHLSLLIHIYSLFINSNNI
jgi:hypothetical protein